MDADYLRDRDFDDLTPLEQIRVGMLSIRCMIKKNNLDPALADRWIDEGISVPEARSRCDRILTETNNQKPLSGGMRLFDNGNMPDLPPNSQGDWEPLLPQKNRSY